MSFHHFGLGSFNKFIFKNDLKPLILETYLPLFLSNTLLNTTECTDDDVHVQKMLLPALPGPLNTSKTVDSAILSITRIAPRFLTPYQRTRRFSNRSNNLRPYEQNCRKAEILAVVVPAVKA